MKFLIEHIQKTADIADGWIVGRLVLENERTYIQLENGDILPATGVVEIKFGGSWLNSTQIDLARKTNEGWPVYAGLDARMMK